MSHSSYSRYFTRSRNTGIGYQLGAYVLMLLCGYAISELLEQVLAADWGRMYPTALLTAGLIAVSVLFRLLLLDRQHRRGMEDLQSFRQALYAALLDRRITVQGPGALEVKLSGDAETVAGFFQDTLPQAVGGAVMLCASGLLLYLAEWRVGILFFCLNLLQLLPILLYERWARQIYNETHSVEETYNGWILEGLSGAAALKSHQALPWYLRRFQALSQAIFRSGQRAERAGAVENIVFAGIENLLSYGSYVILGLFVLSGEVRVAQLPLLIVLSSYLFSSIGSIFTLRLRQFAYQEACRRLGSLTDPPPCPDRGGDQLLAAHHVEKSYGDKQVLRDASLALGPGDRILLQGGNGTGKTTLLRILLGLEVPDRGQVVYGPGLEPRGAAYALQEEPRLDVPARRVLAELEQAGGVDGGACRTHLAAFHVGVDLLDKSLMQMSAGERKKFYLAAAMAKSSPLLLLDEPTNHLDRDSVSYLLSWLSDYHGALLVCSHEGALPLAWTRTIRLKGGVSE